MIQIWEKPYKYIAEVKNHRKISQMVHLGRIYVVRSKYKKTTEAMLKSIKQEIVYSLDSIKESQRKKSGKKYKFGIFYVHCFVTKN